MIYLLNDYSVLAAEEVLARIRENAGNNYGGYGLDEICDSAKEKLHSYLKDDGRCDIHFLVGGTQANQIMIAGMLRPYEGVIAVETGHINVHECGAIEATGHKVETIKPVNGKLTAADLEAFVKARDDEHMVQLGAVYISQATELGTVYTRKELAAISKVCRDNGLYLYVDGARLGVALVSDSCEGLKMSDLVELCDCFYIGATKNGGMLGEAMVIVNDDLKPHFRSLMKHQGGLLAKGWLIGLQYDVLFTDDLYFRLAEKAVRYAEKLKKGLQDLNIEFLIDSPTNQQFPIFDNGLIEHLEADYAFYIWEKGEKKSAVRMVTSFASREEDIDALLREIDNYQKTR